MLSFIDNFLNSITMYRLTLYCLRVLAVISIISGFFGIVPYSGIELILALCILVSVCFSANYLISKILKIPANFESPLITSLLLFFILSPSANFFDTRALILAGIIAMASKYLITFNKKHIFNPAAFATLALGLTGFGDPFWWIGNQVLTPIVLILGFLIARKLRKFTMFILFFIVALLTAIVMGIIQNVQIPDLIFQIITSWPIIFFGLFMLTEPQTTPQLKKLQIAYAVLIGFLFSSQLHNGIFYASPELALVSANLVFFVIKPKRSINLFLEKQSKLSEDILEFSFNTNSKLNFIPGQYLEWTLAHSNQDQRGMRRFFTIASSPTEKDLKLGVRYAEKSSSFKKALSLLKEKQKINASGLYGEFTMPKNTNQKLVFISGGIGVTPFRSMIKYLIDTNEKRDIVLFYCVTLQKDIVYKEIFDEAEKKIGLKVIYLVTDKNNISGWKGKTGRIDENLIKSEVPDYMKRKYYLSGPNKMVDSYKNLLLSLSISNANIVTDYFPGY